MQAFAYSNSPYPIRADLPAAYREAWLQLSCPGTWWTGHERLAIATEVRNAGSCKACTERKLALSPFAPLDAAHNSTTSLPERVIDVVHRLVKDPSRLTQAWLNETVDDEFTKPHYIEVISVVVTTLCIDGFHQALGFALEPLPEAQEGQPSQYSPEGLETQTAWVPMIKQLADNESDLWDKNAPANVIRALSVVPDAVRLLKSLSAVQYVPMEMVANPKANGGREISRRQIEFIAARVSAINDCFY